MCKEYPVILQNDVLHWGRELQHGQVRSMKQKFQHTEQMHNSNQALHDSHSHCAARQPTFHNHEPLLFRLLHSSNGLLLKAPLCLPKFPKLKLSSSLPTAQDGSYHQMKHFMQVC